MSPPTPATTSRSTCAPSTRRARAAPGSATRSTSGRASRRSARSGARCSTPSAARRSRSRRSARAWRRPDGWIAIGDGALGPTGAPQGERPGPLARPGSSRSRGAEPPLRHLPSEWMYRAPLPRTKLESPVPDATFGGWVEAGGRHIEVRAGAGWSATTGAASTPSAGSGCTAWRSPTCPARGSTSRSAASRSAGRTTPGSPTARSRSTASACASAASPLARRR